MEINEYIDHTLLAATATSAEIIKICEEAKEYKFHSVCVNSSWVPLVKKQLEGSTVQVCSVIGFPLGAMSKEAKVFEAKTAVEQGADEIDMVINVGLLKECKYDLVEQEIASIKKAIGNKILKVIIETCYLDNDQKVKACELAVAAKADFVKTSTGFGKGGATVEDVALMLKTVGSNASVKASGGVRDYATASKYIEMGVKRLGTSSGIAIIKGRTI